jgi:queuosine precursor transporter
MTNPPLNRPPRSPAAIRGYRYYPWVTAIFVTALVVSNIVAVKLIQVGPFTLTAALLIFSVDYIFGDVLTEVYGYARARQVIWIGFACNLLAVIAFWTAGRLSPSPFWTLPGFDTPAQAQGAYDAILGFTPLILLASLAAYLVGEFLNSFVLAKLKLATRGRWLWVRTIGSTLIAQVADTGIFVTILVIGGLYPRDAALAIIGGEWLSKVLYEVLATPITYQVVNFLKRAEQEDYYDWDTDFNPLTLS